jgi:DNA ligase (NAD+)
VTDLTFRMTPKLDGLAGNDVGGVLATRGNGRVGSDITNAFKKGLVAIGGRGQGLGEIVIQQSYFEKYFTDIFDHPRNMAVGIVKADNVNTNSQKALDDKKVHFVPYTTLAKWEGSSADLVAKTAEITGKLRKQVDYAMDGMVAEVTDQTVKDHMGATSHHYRWQIAIKERGETAITTVKNIVWQTGRTGNITPVLEIETIRLSGANISRVTAHNAGMVRDRELGVGARVEIIRSGEVIPKLENVIKPALQAELATECPSCGTALVWKGDFLNCTNGAACSAQVISILRHFFRILGTADGFGERNLTRLVDGGFVTLEKVYALTEADLLKLEFGAGQTKNLLEALVVSRKTRVEDARFLAAFGIHDLGVGDSRKLLRQFKLSALDKVTAEQLEAVKGFGAVTSESITSGLAARWPTITHMLGLKFTLDATPLESEAVTIVSPVSGKTILFTGKMLQGTRDAMKKQAINLGATISSSISKKLGILVIGDKASAAKVSKAKTAGVTVLTEAEYLKLLAG